MYNLWDTVTAVTALEAMFIYSSYMSKASLYASLALGTLSAPNDL